MGTFLLAALMVLVAVGLSLGADRAVVRLTQPGQESPGASELLGALFSVYGILLSLVIVSVWDGYQRAREILTAEASAAVDVVRATESLPPPLGPRAAAHAWRYEDLVLSVELPAMASGEVSRDVSVALVELWKEVAAFNPVDEREKILQEIALYRVIELGNQRRLRLIANERRLPPLLWSVLLLGGSMVIGFSALLGARAARSRALRVAIAGLIGLVMFTILALARPFQSPARIEAGEIRSVSRLLLGEERLP